MMRVMAEVFQRVCKKKKSLMLEFDGEEDHVHLLIDLHPDNNERLRKYIEKQSSPD